MLAVLKGNNNAVFVGGNTGEANVRNLLIQTGYKFYHNIYLEDDKGNLCQIDFLLITDTSIVIIEVKNYTKCVVMGDSKMPRWTACYLRNNKTFNNPIKQNQYHIDIAKNILKKDNLSFWNVVAFPSGCNVRVENDLTTNVRVIDMSNLWYALIDAKSTRRINAQDRADIIKTLDGFQNRIVELSAKHQKTYFNR